MTFNDLCDLVVEVNSKNTWSFLTSLSKKHNKKLYPNLSEEEYNKYWNGPLQCEAAARSLENRLESLKVPYCPLFIYTKFLTKQDPLQFAGLNRSLLNYVVDHYVKDFPIPTYGELLPATHALVEVYIEKIQKYIVADPYAGIVYKDTKENLLKGDQDNKSTDFYNHWLNTISYLKNSIHIDNATWVYATPQFWKGIYRITTPNPINVKLNSD